MKRSSRAGRLRLLFAPSSWVFLVAGRYFKTRRKEKGNAASVLSAAGIAVGVMTLIAVLSVMNGFQLNTIEAILELNSYHLRILPESPDGALPAGSLMRLAEIPGVRSAFLFTEIQTLIRAASPDSQVCVLRALPTDIMKTDPSLAEKLEIVQGSFDLEAEKGLVLGSELARRLRVKAGDYVSLLNMAGADFTELRPENLVFHVRGVFKSGYYEYDLGWGFLSLENAKALMSAADTVLTGIKLDDRFDDEAVFGKARQIIGGGGQVVSWREYNKAIFGALRVEKIMLMVLIGLIFVVVASNIYQSLRRSVYERTEEIGVLKALGADPFSIRLIFILEGAFIGLAGCFFGQLLGFLVAGHINEIFSLAESALNRFIFLVNAVLRPWFPEMQGQAVSLFSPAYFYLTEVPSKISWTEALFIYSFAMLSTTLAAYFASGRVASIKPAEVLRYE
ncbi:MAG: ABC transporter permease [Spirochaetales bacterium]|jgi:lipoprotein-releasing system permease protein|nr:ABC transporter permease [Spirochaetales bacterium]